MEDKEQKFSGETGVGLLLGIPTLGRPLVMEWAWAFKMLSPPINYNMRFSQLWNRPIAEARNMFAEEAVKRDCKYLFLLGDDVVVPPHTLRTLIYRMENDPTLGIVSGIYCVKSEPPYPLVFRKLGQGAYWDWKIGEYFEVCGVGMDCALIRTEVFNEVNKPWFKTVDNDEFLDGKPKADQWTEDLYFCKKLLDETDYKIYADASVICEHWDPYKRKKYVLPKDSIPMQRPAVGDKKILDVGCGLVHWEFEGEGIPVRVDIRESAEPDYRCDVRRLPFDKEQFDVVFSCHVLEHFKRDELGDILDEWLRVLKPDGEFRIIIPNLMWAAEQLIKNDGDMDYNTLNVLYGEQSYPYDFHYNGFTPKRMGKLLAEKGLEIVEKHEDGFNLVIRALYKEESKKLDAKAKKKKLGKLKPQATKKKLTKAKKKK